jgi:hypothetical protein
MDALSGRMTYSRAKEGTLKHHLLTARIQFPSNRFRREIQSTLPMSWQMIDDYLALDYWQSIT